VRPRASPSWAVMTQPPTTKGGKGGSEGMPRGRAAPHTQFTVAGRKGEVVSQLLPGDGTAGSHRGEECAALN